MSSTAFSLPTNDKGIEDLPSRVSRYASRCYVLLYLYCQIYSRARHMLHGSISVGSFRHLCTCPTAEHVAAHASDIFSSHERDSTDFSAFTRPYYDDFVNGLTDTMNIRTNLIEINAGVKRAWVASPSDDHFNNSMHNTPSKDTREE